MIALLLAMSCGSDAAEPAATPAAEVAATEAAVPTPAGDHQPVPEVRFEYFDGSEGTLADLAGTPAVINFWASWCPPCITEMPAFEAVHVELAPQVAFLGFNVGDEPGAARELAERTGVTYPLAEDPDSSIFQAFGGFGMPTTVLVDAQGMIVHMISSRLRAQDLRALIAEHLGV
ncbi:MAG: TlpA disulfide reductase family protein [bacterium]|nr:TlpA disulfide reductase family protein [bacterium]